MEHKLYQNYTVEDFITDTTFIDWVKNPDSIHKAFWEAWVARYAYRKKDIEEARQFILNINFDHHQLTAEAITHDHLKLKAAIQPATPVKPHPAQHFRFRSWYSIAAVFIGLLILAFAYFYTEPNEIITHTTAYGETKTITLPDSSMIILNANSSIQYPARWDEREVWLQGEAFFEVQELLSPHTSEKVKFRVKTEDVMVEVLGTEFNVHHRQGKTAVVLQSGKVKLTANALADTGIEMLPGDYASFSETQHTFERKQVHAEDYSAWRENRLVFRNASLEEIALLLKENYGLDAKFKAPGIAAFRYTGTTPADNIDELFTKLSLLFPIEVRQKDNQIIFDKQ